MAFTTKPKKLREDLKSDEVLCSFCPAKCCRYFALPIDTPESFEDFEFIRWYLLHESASVFLEEEDWYLLVHTKCKFLGEDHRCQIYETRPQICRDYSTKNCEYEDEWTYDHYFETPEQVSEYYEAISAKSSGPKFRSPKPALLPIAG